MVGHAPGTSLVHPSFSLASCFLAHPASSPRSPGRLDGLKPRRSAKVLSATTGQTKQYPYLEKAPASCSGYRPSLSPYSRHTWSARSLSTSASSPLPFTHFFGRRFMTPQSGCGPPWFAWPSCGPLSLPDRFTAALSASGSASPFTSSANRYNPEKAVQAPLLGIRTQGNRSQRPQGLHRRSSSPAPIISLSIVRRRDWFTSIKMHLVLSQQSSFSHHADTHAGISSRPRNPACGQAKGFPLFLLLLTNRSSVIASRYRSTTTRSNPLFYADILAPARGALSFPSTCASSAFALPARRPV